MILSPDIQSKVLRRSRGKDDYAIYQAALEWGLVDPIVIDSRADLKSEVRWHDRVEPYHHQVSNLITYCRRLPVTLLADDVGLGKTISAGLIASELISRRRLSKILIVAPKLLGPQWRDELTGKFNIPTIVATGKELLDADPDGDVGAVVTTYHSAREYIKRIPADRFQMLILDEAHKLRNLYGVNPPPQVAVRFREVLSQRAFKFVLMLTATPIQNRLWDLYSLVDLLTVARGHENPFGTEGMFARRFIADNRMQARQLKADARDQFRSIVYGYMSRVRRADADLHFPDRNVLLRSVPPTPQELELIKMIAKPIEKLNRLAQISILQGLASSPDALAAQLRNMGRKGTFPPALAQQVWDFVQAMPRSAKLQGVAALVEELRKEKPKDWRMVVFTQRRETQTTIQSYLEQQGIPVGIINGDSGERNQDTIQRFKASPPKINVIVSTEAGSEGVNLQAANVLVNYDLPWNPMIVEQRIGRIQRLASDHAKVFVYSVILKRTFEEYIVGRLMEKLQMASHAIGDVEALLEASGLAGEEDSDGFEEEIRRLVMDSLAGKDVEAAMRKAEDSIAKAKTTLAEEQGNIDTMLGAMDGSRYQGPQSPSLPPATRSLPPDVFALAGLTALGAKISKTSNGLYACELEGQRSLVDVGGAAPPNTDQRIVSYQPGAASFDRLVARLTQSGVHDIRDLDEHAAETARDMARQWLTSFGATERGLAVDGVEICYSGTALLQMRATVAHDSYERLVTIVCSPDDHHMPSAQSLDTPLPAVVERPQTIGLDMTRLGAAGAGDEAIAEFCRFYLERRRDEVAAAAGDARKAKKLEDDFTPRLQATVVGLKGEVHRIVRMKVVYAIDGEAAYSSTLTLVPSASRLVGAPELARCAATGRDVPATILATCDVSGQKVLRHRLVSSEISDRKALPQHLKTCSLSGKRALQSELETSSVTGQPVARHLLKTSGISGKKAEPAHIGRCEFTGIDALKSELAISHVSGRPYRADQSNRSALSGKVGHTSEFIVCPLSQQILLTSEADRCELTGRAVAPGHLQRCSVTNKRVLPALLERSMVSGTLALAEHMVTSSVSGTRLIDHEALRSADGKFCTRSEARSCAWSGALLHPDDTAACALTGLVIHRPLLTTGPAPALRPLTELLDGSRRAADASDLWPSVAQLATAAVHGRCTIEAGQMSPHSGALAVCAQVKTLLGLKVRHAGFIYIPAERSILGRLAIGKRSASGWIAD